MQFENKLRGLQKQGDSEATKLLQVNNGGHLGSDMW